MTRQLNTVPMLFITSTCVKSLDLLIISRNIIFNYNSIFIIHYSCFRIKYRVTRLWGGFIKSRNNYRLGLLGLVSRNEIDIAANGALILSKIERYFFKNKWYVDIFKLNNLGMTSSTIIFQAGILQLGFWCEHHVLELN